MDPELAYSSPHTPGEAIHFSNTQSPFVSQQLKIRMMIERYRTIGHQFAKVDPLHMEKKAFVGSIDQEVLGIKAFDFTPEELAYHYSLKSGRAADA